MSVETRKILTPIKIMEVSSAQKQGEWKLRNTLLIPNSKLLFSSKNNLEYTTTKKVASREVWLEWNSSKNLWVYTSGPDSQRGACNFWVFTWGPSPSIAAGCLHLEPAQCTIHQLYLGQISASAVGVYMWTQPSYYLNHYLLGKADQDSESFESESLVMLPSSLVIS